VSCECVMRRWTGRKGIRGEVGEKYHSHFPFNNHLIPSLIHPPLNVSAVICHSFPSSPIPLKPLPSLATPASHSPSLLHLAFLSRPPTSSPKLSFLLKPHVCAGTTHGCKALFYFFELDICTVGRRNILSSPRMLRAGSGEFFFPEL
jgi:hypothetical protein